LFDHWQQKLTALKIKGKQAVPLQYDKRLGSFFLAAVAYLQAGISRLPERY
jgi:hypothetical protein